MAISFPTGATSGQTYTYAGLTYVWNPPVWRIARGTMTSGTSGSSGSSGLAGTSGTSGIGSSGTSGTSGMDGISSGQIYYFNYSQTQTPLSYKALSQTPSTSSQQIVSQSLSGNSSNNLIAEFITDSSGLGFSVIPGGTQRFHLHLLKPASNDHLEVYCQIDLCNSAGTSYSTLIGNTNTALIGWVDSSTPVETNVDIVLPTTTILTTDRMRVRIYANSLESSTKLLKFYTEGTSYYSFVVTSVGVLFATSGTSGTGVAGTSGTSGTSGAAGASGSSGTSGTSGTGVSGTSGTSGTSGAAGASGSSGTSGTSGTGVSGTSGTSGTSGAAGASGSSGTSGTSGTGVSGTSGTSGTSPAAGGGGNTALFNYYNFY